MSVDDQVSCLRQEPEAFVRIGQIRKGVMHEREPESGVRPVAFVAGLQVDLRRSEAQPVSVTVIAREPRRVEAGDVYGERQAWQICAALVTEPAVATPFGQQMRKLQVVSDPAPEGLCAFAYG